MSLLYKYSKFLVWNYHYNCYASFSIQGLMKLSCPNTDILVEMKLLSTPDNLVEPWMITENKYTIDSDQVNIQFTQTQSPSCQRCASTNDSRPVPKTLILMPGAIQIHRHIHLIDAKISKKTFNKLYELLTYYTSLISKSNKNVGQTDLIQMHITAKPNTAAIAA